MSDLLPDFSLLANYAAGRASPEEQATVEAWIAEDPERRKELTGNLIAFWKIPEKVFANDATFDRNAIFDGVEKGIVSIDTKPRKTTDIRSRQVTFTPASSSVRRVRWWSYAAFVVFIAIGIVIGRSGDILLKGGSSSDEWYTYSTPYGQRASLTLSDGTEISLNVGSQVQIASDYSNGNHTIRLEGEAQFAVQHNTRNPLNIITASAVTRVLGTTFVVRQYENDTTVTVAVIDGKVSVQDAVVTAGEQIVMQPSGAHFVTAVTSGSSSFINGVLTIENIPLSQAIKQLNRWYDIDIRLAAIELGSRRITGEFASGNRDNIEEILSNTFNAKVVRDGQILTLYPR